MKHHPTNCTLGGLGPQFVKHSVDKDNHSKTGSSMLSQSAEPETRSAVIDPRLPQGSCMQAQVNRNVFFFLAEH